MIDEKLKEKVEKKLKEGWIKSWMAIEVLAITEEAAKSALEKHIARMEKENKTLLYKKDFKSIKKVASTLRNIKEAYSYIVEIELLTETYEKLVYLVMNYAPSSIEILEPGKIEINLGEAQSILNSLAEMMHKFAASGAGGVIIST